MGVLNRKNLLIIIGLTLYFIDVNKVNEYSLKVLHINLSDLYIGINKIYILTISTHVTLKIIPSFQIAI